MDGVDFGRGYLRQGIIDCCAKDFLFFVNVFAWILEPRDEDGNTMLPLLKRLEFEGWDGCCDDASLGVCPVCKEHENQGHAADCELAALIAKAEGR